MTPYVSGKPLRDRFPADRARGLCLAQDPVITPDGQATCRPRTICWVDAIFFDVLPLPFVRGDPRRA